MKYKLENYILDALSSRTNRSKGQTQELYNLVDGDLDKLMKLELKLKNCFIMSCPSTKEEVDKIMLMEQKTNWFKFDYNANYYLYKVYEYFLESSNKLKNNKCVN